MKYSTTLQRTVACCAALAMLAGCATAPGNQSAGSGQKSPCEATIAAVGGGLLGAIVGGAIAGRDGALIGAALGGASGYAACLAYTVQTVQKASAKQVEAKYRQQNNGALPPTPKVVNYNATLTAPAVQRGQRFQVQSDVEVVNGSTQPVQSMREELLIYKPDGEQIFSDPKSKPFTAKSGGRYENAFAMALPANSPQGAYRIKTSLYVNETHVASRDLQAQVALIDNMPQIVQIVQLASRY